MNLNVLAAMGVDFAFSNVCNTGSTWRIAEFDFGLDRSGKIYQYNQGEFWKSFATDLAYLKANLSSEIWEPDWELDILARKINHNSSPSAGALLRKEYVSLLLKQLDVREMDWYEFIQRSREAADFIGWLTCISHHPSTASAE